MKRQSRISIVIAVLMLSILACNLPGNRPAEDLFPPTPNATMTELFAQATLLTPDFNQPEFETVTPTTDQEPAVVSPTFTIHPTITTTVTNSPGITSTFTPPPTVTPSVPKREGGYFVAKYMSTPPVIDGDWFEWTTTQYPANMVVYGLGDWENAEDLKSAFRVGWDNSNLYIAVKIVDEKYVQNATGIDIFKGDSIELLLDIDLYNDFTAASLGADDFQIGISPGKPNTSGTKEAYLWYPAGKAGALPQITIAAVGGDELYRIEAAIPWTIFGITPSVNSHFGFAISVSDNDDPGSNVQQSMVSSASTRKLTDPTSWGELVLGN